MARSDLMVSLVKAGASGDWSALKATVEAISAEARARSHHILADRLERALSANARPVSMQAPAPAVANSEALIEITPQLRLSDLVLPDHVRRTIGELVEEQMRADLLRAHGLQPRHRVLLAGPPGNGKTSLAEVIAEALGLSLYVVRYEALIGSYLGETNTRLKRLFDQSKASPCVLFFDEFDAIGKERGDRHETGEIKRVVASLLTQIDALPSYVIVITATNHPELLDRAVWRRFEIKLELPAPDQSALALFFEDAFRNVSLGTLSGQEIARRVGLISFAEATDFIRDVQRRRVLVSENVSTERIILGELNLRSQRFVSPPLDAKRSNKASAQARRSTPGDQDSPSRRRSPRPQAL